MGGISDIAQGIARMPVSPAQTGLVMGTAAAAWSLRPSLLPRDAPTQTGVTLGSFALGFGVGAGLNAGFQRVANVAARGGGVSTRAITMGRLGVIGVGAGIGMMALPIARKRDFPFANTLESTGRIALVAGLGSLGVQAHTYAVSRLGSTPRQRMAVNAALVGAEVLGLGILLENRRRRYARHDATVPSARTALIAGGVTAAAYLAVRGEMSLARRLVSKVTGTTSWKVHAGLAALAGAGVLGYALLRPKPETKSEPLRLETQLLSARGPGTGTEHAATLDEPGIRFLQGTLRGEQIDAATGRSGALDPIRVAVGYRSAQTPEARAALALDKLRELGAYDRANMFLAIAPGAGMIDDRLPASVELLAGGDSASVVVPYSDRASFLSLDRIQDGRRTVEVLLDGIHRELDARRARGESVPKLLMYGNSLGAWSGQELFLDQGVKGVLDKVDRVLWVGSPGPSGWRQQTLFPKRETARDPLADRVREFSDVSEIRGLDRAEREHTAIWMHTRASDPVARVDVDMLWRRPLYLQQEHKDQARMPKNAAYVPGVSFLQELGDVLTTSRIAESPDRQQDGHTYRTDIVPDVAAAFFPHVEDPALLGRVEKAVTAQEAQLEVVRRRQRAGA